jgi:hypothetical protein
VVCFRPEVSEDTTYCKAEASMVNLVHLNAHTVVTFGTPTFQPTSPSESKLGGVSVLKN